MLAVLVAVFFAGMGVLALAAPERITAVFDRSTLAPDARNEVRAVYGGFGLAIAAILFAAPSMPEMSRGIYLTVAVALAGMAAGRLISAMIERPAAFYPCWFYCAAESAMAVVLLAASGAPGI